MKKIINATTISVALLSIISIQGLFGESSTNKNQYHLFHPTPSHLLRDLTTDRPDFTESPNTVDTGHLLLETDIINFSYDRHTPSARDIREMAYRIGTTNMRIGITNNIEANIIVEPYVQVRTKDRDTRQTEQRKGFGDITLRSKINLWGNEEGKTAFALLPFIKLPTNSDDVGGEHVEGGILFPFSIGLTEKLGLGAQSGVNFIKNEDTLPGSDYATEFIFSASMGYSMTEKTTGYLETIKYY